MALTPEQIAEAKRQILEQTKHLPEDRRKQIEEQLEQMTPEQLEAFITQQMAAQGEGGAQQNQAIFRSIVSGDIPSKVIDQNKQAIAVLDIKPISKGHTVIIPKTEARNTKELPTQAFSLAKKISKKIITKLKAQGTEIQTQFSFGEVIINVIPVYDKPVSINSPREEAKEEELEEIHKLLRVVKRPPVIRQRKRKPSSAIKLKRRVP